MSAQKMIKENIKEDLSISVPKANLYAILTSLPFILLFSINYIYLWGLESFSKGFIIFNFRYFLLIILISIPFHEIIHWIILVIGKKSVKNVKFGFRIKALCPYVHCKVPVAVQLYRIAIIMPGIILGILPSVYGIITGDSLILFWGLVFIITAGGDLLVLWLIRKVSIDEYVLDHPKKAGCYIIKS